MLRKPRKRAGTAFFSSSLFPQHDFLIAGKTPPSKPDDMSSDSRWQSPCNTGVKVCAAWAAKRGMRNTGSAGKRDGAVLGASYLACFFFFFFAFVFISTRFSLGT
ncbi:hypothetical protein LX36DRAFT_21417 [Colletotrichum falcatum]|nr:hypothetical protein LX36DRAFT_21417 [Colletotrichum falcatum]